MRHEDRKKNVSHLDTVTQWMVLLLTGKKNPRGQPDLVGKNGSVFWDMMILREIYGFGTQED